MEKQTYWIARDTDGDLYIHNEKPSIDVNGYWISNRESSEIGSHFFPWIQNGECFELGAN
tara:strand:+ start:1819 stop:1998 length:180 start_codon:yes stop_codon:yes gene_type:complete